MSEISERPLVTFALFAYNQEQYIREAVEAALVQDYSPLEIILSDDCSKDRTFEIMQEMVAGYAGPHRIILNRNPVNVGVGQHVNRVVELASGELIVGAAGDDVSRRDRVTETMHVWLQGGKKATSIYSAVEFIDELGNSLGIRSRYQAEAGNLGKVSEHHIGPYGASHAFCRQLMARFEKMSDAVINEDQVIGFRSALVGALSYIDKPLVKYRIHGSSLCSKLNDPAPLGPQQTREYAYVDACRSSIFRRQNVRDALLVLDRDHPVLAALERQVIENDFAAAVFGRKLGFWGALPAAWSAMARGASKSAIGKVLVKAAIWPIYARYYDYRRRLVVRRKQERNRHGT